MLPASTRLPELRTLIDQQAYFVVHAPRPVGKTTMMLQLAQELVTEGRYNAAVVTAEPGAAFPNDTGAAELAVLGGWRADAVLLPAELQPPPWPKEEPGARIRHALQAWALASPRPLAVFIDEIDSLQDDALLSFLRQLRAGYPQRPKAFPWSLALIGLRDVRDYKVKSGGSERLTTLSPFNIKLESLTLGDFTEEEVATLYRQHTADTGQVTLAMELKVWRDGESDPLKEGLEQLDHYLDGLGLATGWLVIFDQRSGLPEISERTTTETATTPSGRNLTVIRG